MKLVSITESSKPDKKMMAIFEQENGRKKTVHFGQAKAPDFIKSGDKEQRERYRTRHAKDLQTEDPTRAGFLSYYILWGDSTSIKANIASYKKRFSL
jgi:hypothetical protein